MGIPTTHDADLDDAIRVINSGECVVRERMAFLRSLRQGQRIVSGQLEDGRLILETVTGQVKIANIDRIVLLTYVTYSRVCVWATFDGRLQLVLQLRYDY